MTPQSPRTPSRASSPRRPGWRTGDVARGAVVVLVVYAAAKFLIMAQALVFATFLGVLFGLAVSSGVDVLQPRVQYKRFRLPRGVWAATIVVGFLSLLVGFGTWTGPTVREQYKELQQRLPEAFVKVDQWIGQHEDGLIGKMLSDTTTANNEPKETTQPKQNKTTFVPVMADSAKGDSAKSAQAPISTDTLTHINSLKDRLFTKLSGGVSSFVFPVISSTFAVVSGVILVIFLSIYIGADPEIYRNGLLSLVPRHSQARLKQVFEASSTALRRWLVTQLIAMLVIGGVTTAALLALDVRAALPLGILAGLLEFVPTVGPILSSVPAIAMAFVDSPEKALVVAGAYVIIQFLENQILIPLLMKEGVDLPPVLTILTQTAMAVAFGFMGLFVAVPVLVLVSIFVKMLYVEDVIGVDADLPYTDDPEPAPR